MKRELSPEKKKKKYIPLNQGISENPNQMLKVLGVKQQSLERKYYGFYLLLPQF